MKSPKNLKQLRNKLGISQQELADKLSVGQTTIANYDAFSGVSF